MVRTWAKIGNERPTIQALWREILERRKRRKQKKRLQTMEKDMEEIGVRYVLENNSEGQEVNENLIKYFLVCRPDIYL